MNIPQGYNNEGEYTGQTGPINVLPSEIEVGDEIDYDLIRDSKDRIEELQFEIESDEWDVEQANKRIEVKRKEIERLQAKLNPEYVRI